MKKKIRDEDLYKGKTVWVGFGEIVEIDIKNKRIKYLPKVVLDESSNKQNQ